MPASSRRPVLVTGSIRSGTTWVGRMLCLSGELVYLHEPFNPTIWPRWFPEPLPFRNLYVTTENEAEWREPMARVLERRSPLLAQMGEISTPKRAAQMARDIVLRTRDRRRPGATLVKDPIALFSSEWMATTFDLDVVVMVRSPVAYASSIKRLGWSFDFANWAGQDLLLRDHLAPFAEQIVDAAAGAPLDASARAILFWNASYHYADRMRAAHPDWHFVTHEELAIAPVDGFAALHRALGLRYDAEVRAAVASHSATGNAIEVPQGVLGGVRRDSRASTSTWRQRLDPDEIARIRDGTAEVASRFYVDADWMG